MRKRIVLIRHCTPNIPNVVCSAEQAHHYLEEYDKTEDICLSEIDAFSSPDILDEIKQCEYVYSSPLPRAYLTACHLFEQNKIIICDDLKEFNLSIANIPFISLFVQHWFVISRLLWLVGMNQAGKTLVQEKSRVRDFMQQLPAKQNCSIVAHGFVIREIKNILLKQGYSCLFCEKHGCFNITIFGI